MVSLALLLALAAPVAAAAADGAAAPGAVPAAESGSDLEYFGSAKPSLKREITGVVEILVSHRRKPSSGFKRIPFQPKPDSEAEPLIDCEALEPQPRGDRRDLRGGYHVCGVRLLRWVLGDADRIHLAVTDSRSVGKGKYWLQVVTDPEKDARAWLRFVAGPGAAPLMKVSRVADWVTRERRVTLPAALTRGLILRAGPAEESEPAARGLPAGRDLPLAIRGTQGGWMHVALDTEHCAGLSPERAERDPACPDGWIPWLSDDGIPLVYP